LWGKYFSLRDSFNAFKSDNRFICTMEYMVNQLANIASDIYVTAFSDIPRTLFFEWKDIPHNAQNSFHHNNMFACFIMFYCINLVIIRTCVVKCIDMGISVRYWSIWTDFKSYLFTSTKVVPLKMATSSVIKQKLICRSGFTGHCRRWKH